MAQIMVVWTQKMRFWSIMGRFPYNEIGSQASIKRWFWLEFEHR